MKSMHPPAPCIRRFGSDTRAASAVEFALILPIMLLLLLASFDIGRAIDVKTKLAILSRTISDFVTQSQTITPAQLANIVQASKSVMYPYSDSSTLLTIDIQSIRQQPNLSYQIDWSYPPANATNRATTLTPADTSVVRTSVTYVYNLQFAGFLLPRLGLDKITLRSSTVMAPRWGSPVEATSF
jgi:Flp pilus assembly protein TadG